MKYYPVFLDLKQKKVVIVGGGKVAERKALTLTKAGACVTVISPCVTVVLERLKRKGVLTHIKRHYKRGDLKDAFIVIAGTSSTQTNSRIARDAEYLINVIDTPSEGNFVAPSIVNRGPLTIAISTEGHSPAMAKAIRKELEKFYGTEFSMYLRLLKKIRMSIMEKVKDNKERKRIFSELTSERILKALRSGGFKAASDKITQALTVK